MDRAVALQLLMGLLPHASPAQVYASEYYQAGFLKYNERLGTRQIAFKSLIPDLFLPSFLKHKLGYQTHACLPAGAESGHADQSRF